MKPIAAAAALLILTAAPQDKPDKEKKPTAAVRRGDLTPVLKLDARFDPARLREVRIRMESYSGDLKIASVVPSGAAVRKGEAILTIDAAPVKRALVAAERALDIARASHTKAVADAELGAKADALALDRARTSLSDAETNLKVFDEVEGKQMLRRAELNVQFGLDSLNDQKEELDQLLEMYKSEELTNATSEIVVRRARRALERSKIYLEMNKEDARVVKEVRFPQRRRSLHHLAEQARQGLRKLEVEQALSRLERKSAVAASKEALEEQERKVEKLRRDLEACLAKAPFDGRVFYGAYEDGAWPQAERIARTLRPGEKPSTGTVLVTICSSTCRATAELPEARYFDAAIGQSAKVVATARPGRALEGKVRGIRKFTRSSGKPYAVRIDFAEPPADLFPGMRGKATIRGEEKKDVLLVPCKALEGDGTERKATVLAKGKEVERDVRVGTTDGKVIEVLDGLEPGDRVVLPE